VNAVVDRYNLAAREYERYWAPVLEATSATLIDYVEWYAGAPAGDRLTVLDVGTGTGTLVRAALERWPDATVVGTDAAEGMIEVAREGVAGFGERVRFVTGPADRLPLEDRSADLVLSSFVYQLVPDRLAALREAYRVLRPDGVLAYVTWLDRELREPFRPMEEFDEAVLGLGIEEPTDGPAELCAGDLASARAAADQVRRAGFREAVARDDELDYHWTMEAYLEYKLAYDERSLMASLGDEQRRQLERTARDRLSRLPPEAFFWHPPIVFVAARRPPG
jgi:SAM-dependent methyltransferase